MSREEIPILRTVHSMRQLRSTLPGLISLVPTMGMLHSGHMSLISLAARQTSSIIVSIYVNPTQLRASEDHASYPSTLGDDIAALQKLGQELHEKKLGRLCGIFAPTDDVMYPCPQSTDISAGKGCFVTISPLATMLEGADQPSHFVGVATVCLKLFNAVKPHKAYFGEKDYQQVVVVRRLVDDLLLDLDVVVGETVREEDGLAISSRNVYLGSRRRKVATILYRVLSAAENAYREGMFTGREIISVCLCIAKAEQQLQAQLESCDRVVFEIIYFNLSHPATLEDLDEVNPSVGAVLSGAIRMSPLEKRFPGEVLGWRNDADVIRLIDNIRLDPRDANLGLKGTEG